MPEAISPTRLPVRFVLRRLHVLSGVLPLGMVVVALLIDHLMAVYGAEAYNARFGSRSFLREFFFILVPFLFHVIAGFVFAFEGGTNIHQYPRASNIRYFIQRLTAPAAAVWLVWDIWRLRNAVPTNAFFMMNTILSEPVALGLYFAGVTAVGFHFFNGLWGFMVTSGVTVTRSSQDLTWRGFLVLFLFFELAAMVGMAAFVRPDWMILARQGMGL